MSFCHWSENLYGVYNDVITPPKEKVLEAFKRLHADDVALDDGEEIDEDIIVDFYCDEYGFYAYAEELVFFDLFREKLPEEWQSWACVCQNDDGQGAVGILPGYPWVMPKTPLSKEDVAKALSEAAEELGFHIDTNRVDRCSVEMWG